MIRVILVQFAILQIIIAGANTYGDKQIVEMLGEYFSSFKDSPNLIGQRFYENSNEMVFQLEIETDLTRINKALLFGFDTISKFSDISKKNSLIQYLLYTLMKTYSLLLLRPILTVPGNFSLMNHMMKISGEKIV